MPARHADREATTGGRPFCYRCMRAASRCLCAEVETIDTRTEVLILQHPREQHHPFNTARLVALALPNARIEVARGMRHPSIETLPADAAILYPHPDAVDVESLAPDDAPRTLVVLDGTWPHSRRLYDHNPGLRALRHVRIVPERESRYRIRKEPRAECLSTAEAVVFALRHFEPDNRHLDRLLDLFESMVDRQIAHESDAPSTPRFKRPRRREPRRVPDALRGENVIAVYCEAASSEPGLPRQHVQWTAQRLDNGAELQLFVQPQGHRPNPAQVAHMRIPHNWQRRALPLADARRRLQLFAGPNPVLAAWNASSLGWAGEALARDHETVLLKATYSNVRNGRHGTLEAVLAQEGLVPAPSQVSGRARARLGNAVAISRWLRQHGRAAPAPSSTASAPRTR